MKFFFHQPKIKRKIYFCFYVHITSDFFVNDNGDKPPLTESEFNDLLHIVAIYVADVMFLIGPGGYRVGDCTKWDNATRGSTREKHGGGIRPICITGDSRKSFIQTQGKNWAQVGGKGLLGRGQLISISLVKLWW